MRFGLVLLCLLMSVALAGPFLLRYSPTEQDREWAHEPPSFGLSGAHGGHVLGTDGLGRDVGSRLVHGARYTVVTATAGVLSSQPCWERS